MKAYCTYKLLFLFCVLCCSSIAYGEGDEATAEGEEGAAPPVSVIYLQIKPSFVVNFGGGGRLRYLKADIAVRLADSNTARSVQHHMPYIRNNLVMLFASQDVESISSQDGKEALSREALEQVRKVVKEEDDLDGVVDLFFNSLVVQR